MAGTNIDNLNFKVILDDEKFDEKINRDIELAKQLNVQLSALLNVKSKVATSKMVGDATKAAKFQKATADAAAAQERLKTASTNTAAAQERLAAATANAANAQERLKQSQMRTEQLAKRITAQTERQNKAYKQQSRILNELKGLALGYLSIHGAGQLLSSLVRVTGEFELQKTTLAAMLGDLNQAEGIITRIQGLAVESPFQFKELTTYAKQLSAFSVPAQELYDTTKMLADISAGLGVGMDRIVLAYGQVRSAAFLRGQEVRQFTEAGIPILDELAKQFSELEGRAVSTGEVFDKISARLVPFEMVAKVFKDMTSEGGKFYNMQEVQAETLRGKISNLKDAYEVMLNEIGKGQSENLKGAVDWARRLMQNYEETGRTLVELVAAYGVYKTALIALTAATGTFELANHKLLSSLVKAGQWAVKNPYVIIAAGLTAVGYAVYKASTQLEPHERIIKSLSDTTSSFTKSMTTETAKLDAFYAKLELAKEGTEAYADAKKAIYSQYAAYISELQNEGIAVDNLANIYDKLKIKIIDSQKARFREVALRDIDKEYEYQTNALLSEAERATKRIIKKLPVEFSALEKEAVQAYVAGTMSMSDIAGDERLKGLANILTNAADSGNRAWEQFGLSIETARAEFELATHAYTTGLNAIDEIYGKAQNTASAGLNPFVYNLTEGGGKGKSPAQKAIEEQIKSVQKLQDAYEKLMPYLNEVQMKSTLKSLFPNIEAGVIDSLDFNAELERLADELAKFDEDAAQRLLDTIGKDVAGTIAESFRTVEQYKKMLDSWLGEDFNLSGEGVAFDISKIISNLNSEYAKIDQKRAKALDMLNKAQMGDEVALAKVREVYGEEVWKKYLENGEKVIDDLAKKEKQESKKTADEKIRDLADKYVKEQMTSKNVDLTEFEDKTLAQIQTQIDRIKEIRDEAQKEANNAMADVALGNLDKGQYAKWQMFVDVLKQLDVVISDTEEEKSKRMLDNVQKSISSISQLSGNVQALGDAMDNADVARFGEDLGKAADFASGLIESLKANDTIAIIANIASFVISEITNIVTASYEYQRKLNEAAREYRDIMFDIRRESYSGIFGTDEMALAAENAKILAEAQSKYQDVLKEFEDVRFQRFGGSFVRKDSISNTLSDFADANDWELYLDSGELNISALEAYYDAYSSRLTKKQRDLVQNLIESGEAYNEASAQQAEYLISLFSGVADDIAGNMINAFLETGDAVSNLEESFTDLGETIVKSMLKSMIIDDIMNKYEARIKEIFDKSRGLTDEDMFNQLAGVFSEMSGEIEGMGQWLNLLLEYLQDIGIISDSAESGTSDLGEGIKGITEDQANLLASYLNAIRADVSYSKTLWQRMDGNLQRIADMFTSSPTLMEYQAQIAANTYNTAVATQAILDRLVDVIGIGNDGSAIRVIS